MRSAAIFSLLLIIPIGCGRYLFDAPQPGPVGGAPSMARDDAGSGGQGGADVGGASGESGTNSGGNTHGAGEAGNAGNAGSDAGEAGLGGGAGSSAADPDRWLASETFVSSSSAQTSLSLVDLSAADAAPVVLEDTAGSVEAFSGNGRWLLYTARRDTKTRDLYLVDLRTKPAFERQFLLTTGSSMPCRWAPDSSRVACIQDLGSADLKPRAVVSFETSQTVPGPAVLLGLVLPQSAGAATNAERELTFLDRDHLVYSHGANDFALVTWHGQTPGSAQRLGFGGGTIVQQAADGRLLVKRVDPNFPPGLLLADFRAGEANEIEPSLALALSSTFAAAYALQPPAPGDTGAGTYQYYAVNGTQLTRVGDAAAVPGRAAFSFNSVFVGNRRVHMVGERAFVVSIGPSSVVEQEVPGDYDHVSELELDSTGTWLYIGSSQFDAQQRPIAASAKQWLSRLDGNGPGSAQLIGQGYAVAKAQFAPNGQRLVLSGDDTKSAVPVAFWLYDLADASHISGQQLALPLNWSDTSWSADAAYVSFIGGAPGANVRPLYVVDARTPSAPPRLITQCGAGSTSPSPACPALAVFQP